MKTKMQSWWLKQSREQKRGSRMRAENTKELTFITVSMVAQSYGHLQWTLWQPNPKPGQEEAVTERVYNTFLQTPVLIMQFWITVSLPLTAPGLAEESWRVWDCNSQKHTNALMHFSWDQIFPKVINPCCMLWWLNKALSMPINWSFMSAKFLLYAVFLQDVFG